MIKCNQYIKDSWGTYFVHSMFWFKKEGKDFRLRLMLMSCVVLVAPYNIFFWHFFIAHSHKFTIVCLSSHSSNDQTASDGHHHCKNK